MGNLGLYVETARKRSRELRELFLDQGEGIDPKELIAHSGAYGRGKGAI